MMRRRKIRYIDSVNKNNVRHIVMLTAGLLLFFLLNSAVLSLNGFMDWFLNNLVGRTIDVSFYTGYEEQEKNEKEREREEKLLSMLGEDSRVVSYITYRDNGFPWNCWFDVREKAGKEIPGVEHMKSDEGDEWWNGQITMCNYGAVRPYLLTGDCGEPEGNEVILAKYLGYGAGNQWEDGEQYLGKTIKLNLSSLAWMPSDSDETLPYEVKVIGVYDNAAAGLDYEILMAPDTAEELDDIERAIKEGVIDEQVKDWTMYAIVLSSRREAAAFSNDLFDQGIKGDLNSGLNPAVQVIAAAAGIAGNFIAFFLIVTTCINTVYLTEHDIRSRRREFGLLMSFGYQNRELCRGLVKEAVIRAVPSIAVVFLVSLPLFSSVNHWLEQITGIYDQELRIHAYPFLSVCVVVIALAAQGVGAFAGIRQLMELEAADALKDGDVS